MVPDFALRQPLRQNIDLLIRLLHLHFVIVILALELLDLRCRLALRFVQLDVQLLDLLRQFCLILPPLLLIILIPRGQLRELILLYLHGRILLLFLSGQVELIILCIPELVLKLLVLLLEDFVLVGLHGVLLLELADLHLVAVDLHHVLGL